MTVPKTFYVHEYVLAHQTIYEKSCKTKSQLSLLPAVWRGEETSS